MYEMLVHFIERNAEPIAVVFIVIAVIWIILMIRE